MHMLAGFFNGYFWHPLRNGNGYNSWSGILGSFLFSIPAWLFAFYMYVRHHNCHVHRCWRLSWHPHPTHGHPVCKRHHPHHPKGGGSRLIAHVTPGNRGLRHEASK